MAQVVRCVLLVVSSVSGVVEEGHDRRVISIEMRQTKDDHRGSDREI
jgi:hypothetical protein